MRSGGRSAESISHVPLPAFGVDGSGKRIVFGAARGGDYKSILRIGF